MRGFLFCVKTASVFVFRKPTPRFVMPPPRTMVPPHPNSLPNPPGGRDVRPDDVPLDDPAAKAKAVRHKEPK